MKTIWMILIGMVLFNGFLLAFAGFFPQAPTPGGVASVDTFNAYKSPGVLSLIGAESILFIGGGALITFFTRDLKYVGGGCLTTLVSSIWTSTSSVFSNMMNQFPVVGAIYTLISIGIGLLVTVMVLGIFTSQDMLT